MWSEDESDDDGDDDGDDEGVDLRGVREREAFGRVKGLGSSIPVWQRMEGMTIQDAIVDGRKRKVREDEGGPEDCSMVVVERSNKKVCCTDEVISDLLAGCSGSSWPVDERRRHCAWSEEEEGFFFDLLFDGLAAR